MKKYENTQDLRTQLHTEIQARVEAVAKGVPRDYSEYQNLCGVISGLSIAERLVIDLQDREINDDDGFTA
jgi:hypothetical protein